MNTTLRMSLGACTLLLCLVLPSVSDAVEGELCQITVGNSTTITKDAGSFTVSNIPVSEVNVGSQRASLLRVRGYCLNAENELVRGQSEYFDLRSGERQFVSSLSFDAFTPVPETITASLSQQSLNAGDQIQLVVTAVYADTSTRNVSARSEGTVYLSSNPSAITIDENGLVTAGERQDPTLVRLFAFNEGRLANVNVLVGASNDNDLDGDGIPNDIELLFGMNPTNPNDANGDMDNDGLTNKEEIDLGTLPNNPDTDSDGLLDGVDDDPFVPESIAPTIVIISPSVNTIFDRGALISISGIAADNALVQGVSLRVDGVIVATNLPASFGHVVMLPISGDVVIIEAWVSDKAGNTAQTAVTVSLRESSGAANLPAPDITQVININNAGEQSQSGGVDSRVNASGQYIVYSSRGADLVNGDMNNAADVFLFDRATRKVELISKSIITRSSASGWSGTADVSDDGNLVVFASGAADLVLDDTNDTGDIFLYNRSTDTMKRLTQNANGVEADDSSLLPRISGDGNWVVFQSRASNLVEGDTPNTTDIFLVNLFDGSITLVSQHVHPTQTLLFGHSPDMSANGERIVFISSDNLTNHPALNGFTPQVFLYDRVSGVTTLVTQTDIEGSGGGGGSAAVSAALSAPLTATVNKTLLADTVVKPFLANGEIFNLTISDDGLYIGCTSDANNLTGDDQNGSADVFLYECATQEITRISSVPGDDSLGGGARNGSLSLSEDGSKVAYVTSSPHIVSTPFIYSEKVIVFDRTENVSHFVSINVDGSGSNRSSRQPHLTADGSTVVYGSQANNLIDNDINGTFEDIFISPVNSVSAGGDQAVIVDIDLRLNGSIRGLLNVEWSKLSGPGNATFSESDAVDSFVRFDAIGTYILQLRAFTSSAERGIDDVSITVTDAPNGSN